MTPSGTDKSGAPSDALADALAWVERLVDARVVASAVMSGGLDAEMFRLSLDGRDDVVLRISRGGDWDDDVAHQARMLTFLADTAVPVPQLLGFERDVGESGRPVLLQSLLPGDPTLPLEPSEPWLHSLAATVAAIQAVGTDDVLPDRATAHWTKLAEFDDERAVGLDGQLLEILWQREPGTVRVLGHDDYWIGNTLRDGDRVVGVVDWGDAGLVSPARDVTYCAVDMSLCYGIEYGDRLVQQFRDLVDVADTEVDLWTARAAISSRWFPQWLSGWNGLGVPVRYEEAERRRAELLDRVLTRLV